MAIQTPQDSTLQSSLFFTLPPEVRIKIYELVVRSEHCLVSSYYPVGRRLPVLLLVCKKIRSEAFDVFITKSNFHIFTPVDCDRFARFIGGQANRLRYVTVFIDSDDQWMPCLIRLFSAATYLKEICFRKADATMTPQRFVDFVSELRLDEPHVWEINTRADGTIVHFNRNTPYY
ncbi:hypothetical protein F4775DRAFT_605213 [Biscogniauxia sp. FL1348]|nr:hypothetical protein F4775DRAFT_605213 [Biscogniauxia sp. FL1348]